MKHNGVVQAQFLGRWGNQLFQYAAAKAYAQKIGARFECPAEWIGRKVFQLDDAVYSCNLQEVGEPLITGEIGRTNLRACGYFQSQVWASMMSRAELQRWFQLRPEWYQPRPHPWYIACHLRRGDYVGHQLYCVVSRGSYERAIQKYGLGGPVVWVSDEAPGKASAGPHELGFVPDFVTLMMSDVLLRANSSFSWWAAVLSHADVYAPVVEELTGERDVEFVVGNWPRCAGNALGVTDMYVAG